MSFRSLWPTRSWPVASFALFLVLPAAALAQRQEALIIFKDGFYLRGVVKEERKMIVDHATGGAVSIPSGKLMNLDDGVRRIYFVFGQLQDVLTQKQVVRKEEMRFDRSPATFGAKNYLLPGWQFEEPTDWNDKWERSLKVNVTKPFPGSFQMQQRLVRLTPEHIFIQTLTHNWDLYYLTKEFEADEIRSLLEKYLASKKDLKAFDKRMQIARFLHQAGWLDEAERDLDNMLQQFPAEKKAIEEARETLKQVYADRFVEALERVAKVGQHHEAQDRIRVFEKLQLDKAANPKNALIVRDFKTRYEADKKKLGEVTSLLKQLVQRPLLVNRMFWTKASAMILEELNFDTLPRLELFHGFAEQHLKELEEGKKPAQTTEEVLAMAVTGWLLGNSAAEPDVKMARKLFDAREFVLRYQRNDQPLARKQMGDSFAQEIGLPIDVLARLVRNLPPPYAYEKISGEPFKLDIEVPDSNGGSYHVQLPPDYHHLRPYPVLVLMHSSAEKPLDLLNKWSNLAAEHGFILVAPAWGSGLRNTYSYSTKEHNLVIDTLRDLRRRFQVDSDRVFIFGWEQGAEAALDIGAGHPDQFAGVLAMSVYPRYFPERCWSNFQYLPVYLVDADRSGNAKPLYGFFKNFVSGVYPAVYMQYKGRAVEFFRAEMPTMMDWMSRKKRHHPVRELGRYASGTIEGEEFKTMRECDNRFYWLSTDHILDSHLNSGGDYWNRAIKPATLQCTIAQGNELIAKGGVKEAKVWAQFRIRTRGVKQVTLWLTPGMHDFTKPVEIRLNDTRMGPIRVIPPDPAVLLEELYRSGDRQRLVYAKVDINLK